MNRNFLSAILKQNIVDRKLYALTISPPSRLASPDFLYVEDRRFIMKWLNGFSHHYHVIPEFDMNARLHYHGIIRIDDKFKFNRTKSKMDSGLGFTKVSPLKTVGDHLKYLVYMNKSCHETFSEEAGFAIDRIIYRRRGRRVLKIEPVHTNRKTILDYYYPEIDVVSTIRPGGDRAETTCDAEGEPE